MELTIYFLFLLSFVFTFLKVLKQQLSFLPLVDALSALRMELTLRNFSFEKTKKHKLCELVLESYFQGKPIHASVEILAKEILKAEEFRIAKQRFLSLFALRICVVLSLNFFARSAFQEHIREHSYVAFLLSSLSSIFRNASLLPKILVLE